MIGTWFFAAMGFIAMFLLHDVLAGLVILIVAMVAMFVWVLVINQRARAEIEPKTVKRKNKHPAYRQPKGERNK